MSETGDDPNEAEEFGRRMRTARAWAGYVRREEFVDALIEKWPDWPIKSVVKRIENGEKWPDSRELRLWASRLEEFAGVPQWFVLHGWAGADLAPGRGDELTELRDLVVRHDQMLVQLRSAVLDDPEDMATAAERAAEELSPPPALRSVPSAPKKRAPKR